MKNIDVCIMCGNVVPEGRQVCHECEHRILNENKNIHTYEEMMKYIKENLKHGTESSDY